MKTAKFMILFTGFMVVLLVFFSCGCLFPPSKQSIPISQNNSPIIETKDYYGIIRKAILYPLSFNKYALRMNFSQGKFSSSYTIHDGTNDYIFAKGLIHNEEVFIFKNGTDVPTEIIFCLTFNKTRNCAVVGNSSLLSRVAQLEGLSPEYTTRAQIKELDVLNKSHGLVFLSAQAKGKEQCLTFALNYDKLSLTDLKQIGLLPSDPKLTLFSDYRITYCIADNVLSYTNLSYRYLGREMKSESYFNYDFSDVSFPLVNESLKNASFVDSLLAKVFRIEKEARACMKKDKKDLCFKTLAVKEALPDLCDFAGEERDRCYVILASEVENENICNNIEDGALKDDCFYEIAMKKEDSAICNNIMNETIKDECLDFTGRK